MRDPGAIRRAPRGAALLPPFESLLDDHAQAVLRFLVRRVGSAEAEDCFQETFLAALRAYPRLQEAGNLRGWLLTIARNKAIDMQRDAARRPVPDDAVELVAAAGAEPGPQARDGELWDSVRRLPSKQRSAVALRFVEDRSYDDIARAMEISPDAARQNVHAGIKKLRRERG